MRFVLDDPLLRYWFRFVFPNNSYIQHMGPSRAFRDRIKPELDAYFGGCFERLCREARAVASELESRVAKYPNPRGATIGRRFFVRKKPRGALPAGQWHDLADLFRD